MHTDSTNKTNPLRKISRKGREIAKDRRLSSTLPVDLVIRCDLCGLQCKTSVGLKLHMVKCKKSNKEV